jgi:hypothetical protein
MHSKASQPASICTSARVRTIESVRPALNATVIVLPRNFAGSGCDDISRQSVRIIIVSRARRIERKCLSSENSYCCLFGHVLGTILVPVLDPIMRPCGLVFAPLYATAHPRRVDHECVIAHSGTKTSNSVRVSATAWEVLAAILNRPRQDSATLRRCRQ